jgi:glucose/arabinose dehydrogenase
MAYRVSLSGSFTPALFVNLTSVVGGTGSEEGLLALAFPPGYPTDNRVYVYYTQGSPSPSILARFTVTGNQINLASKEELLQIPQPYSNHNGGELMFGLDGYLYLSLGDGGSGGDPEETGQDNTDHLGSVLRIDVSGATGYAVPASNPFADAGDPGADEVWAYGMRNPWRFSFDAESGELWLADVGQNVWEEVDKVVAGGNYGWDCYEGNASYEPAGCADGTFQAPRAVYSHTDGCAVTGGYVYHGAAFPELAGWYIYGDYCSGKVWAVNTADTASPAVPLMDSAYSISSFAEVPGGEILAVTFNNAVYRLSRD